MEENLPQQDPPSRLPVTPRALLALLVVVFVLSSVVFVGSQVNKNQPPAKENPKLTAQKPFEALAPVTLIYGAWEENASKIKALDLNSGKEYLLAELPSDSKRVHVLDKQSIIYINKTDLHDLGKEIIVHSLVSSNPAPVVTATAGFGIDSYVISPNKRYLAYHELQVNTELQALMGGKSQVYTVDLTNPQTTNTIYTEEVTPQTPIHQPRGITNTGEVFFDSVIPNSGAGWAYGMSVSNFDGTTIQDLDNMKNGTYGTRPTLSDDGTYIVFAGYDGTKGSGTQVINGFRRALLTPNSVEILDTATKERKKLSGVSNKNSYTVVKWDKLTNTIIYNQLSSDDTLSGFYQYNLSTDESKQIIPHPKEKNYDLIAFVSDDALLSGNQFNSSSIANLGASYSTPYTNIDYVQLPESVVPLPFSASLVQYIDLLPLSEMSLKGVQEINSFGKVSRDNLQLETFAIKLSLAPVRLAEQNDPIPTSLPPQPETSYEPPPPSQTFIEPQPVSPSEPTLPPCTNLAQARCQEMGYYANAGIEPQATQWSKCVSEEFNKLKGTGTCAECPLYLYGNKGQQVSVNILTPSYYDENLRNQFAVTLLEEGNLSIDKQEMKSLSFDYTPALSRIPILKKGSIINRAALTETLRKYAVNLGLNQQETTDLIQEANGKIDSPYVFVSFFDHQISHAMLPITFDPHPDTYRNIVFYFKKLSAPPGYTLELPIFEKIKRHGFTAVEISLMVE